MSRIGKKPVEIPAGVKIEVSSDNIVTASGPKGTLTLAVDSDMIVKVEESNVIIDRPTDQKRHKALHGTYRSLINNMVEGVSKGYTKVLELVGVGYKATALNDSMIELNLGYSHAIFIEVPSELKASTETKKGENPKITLESANKELLGEYAAKIRSLRKTEPYKGKGIKFQGEILRRKAGKSASK